MSIECKKKTKNTHTQKKENKKYPPLPKKNHPWLQSGNGIGEGKLMRRISNH